MPAYSLQAVVHVASFAQSAALLASACVYTRKKVKQAQGHHSYLSDDPTTTTTTTTTTALYADEDGTATEESTAKAQNRLVRILIALISSVVILSVLVHFICFDAKRWESVVLLVGWILVWCHAIMVASCSDTLLRYETGLSGAASTSSMLFGTLLPDVQRIFQEDLSREESVVLVLHDVAAFVLLLLLLSLDRRPAVYKNGRPVDAQFTTSIISRFSFSWAFKLIRQARCQGALDEIDLPELSVDYRSKLLLRRFWSPSGIKRPLWQRLVRDHFWDFARQWVVCIVESVVLFGPQICLFKLLELLERRQAGDDDNQSLWIWSGALVITKLIHIALLNYSIWLGWGVLCSVIRAQLIALIFDQSINQPDIKESEKKGEKAVKEQESEDEIATETDPLLPKNAGPEKLQEGLSETVEGDTVSSQEEDKPKELGVTNMLGVDVERIAFFAAENNDFMGSFIKGAIAVFFLIKILGVWSALAGLVIPMIFSPISKFVSNKYTAAYSGLMDIRDRKTHLVTEILQGMRQIKFAAMEFQWQETIMAMRNDELKMQWTLSLWGTALTFFWLSLPIFLGATTLSVYALLHQSLTASVAFTALATLSSLEYTLSVVPALVTELLDCLVSLRRIEEHLDAPRKDNYIHASDEIALSDASICWPSVAKSDSRFVLRGLNLHFPRGELSIVIGKTGSGKSLLLAGLAGEARLLGGSISAPCLSPEDIREAHISPEDWIMPNATALVAQIPWIENASIRDNVLYGLPVDEERYSQVLFACALTQDLDALEDGDATEVGATGINISGGQRWRLTLARALYSRAQTLLLDDIFSAVDSHVGAHILHNAILGPLCAGRTLIIATHHAGLVTSSAKLLVRLGNDGQSHSVEYPDAISRPSPAKSSALWSTSNGQDTLQNGKKQNRGASARKFVEDEFRQVGGIKFGVLRGYFTASGGAAHWLLVTLVLIALAATILGRSYWLKVWTQASTEVKSLAEKHQTVVFYLLIYIGISIFASLMTCARLLIVLTGVIRASHRLFKDMTTTVFGATLRWLDTVPTGRVLNRFVGDFALVDSRLGPEMSWTLNGTVILSSIMAASLFASPLMILPIAVLLFSAYKIVTFYLTGARGLKRLESTTRSPIFELFNTTLSGLATIRTFGKTQHYVTLMTELIDKSTRAKYYLRIMTQWMTLCQGLLGCAFLLCIVVFLVLSPSVNASLAGFVLSFALEYTRVMEMTIIKYTGFELDMNAAERVIEYTNLKTEDTDGADVPKSWPDRGSIQVKDLQVAYAPELEPVLKGVSFDIKAGERVGVVGRTGSGKSTFTLALFRFLDQRAGSISIDGIDISTVRLHDLRSRISIIPQDPVLFTGTLRSNLDPWKKHSDVVLLDTLRRVHLIRSSSSGAATPSQEVSSSADGSDSSGADSHSNIFLNLSHPISRAGLNLSQGQRQLVCLARAILSSPKIMLLDEATSAVDMATDALIQRSIREGFRDSTLVVIAHRLSTVVDFDKVLVLGEGRVVEYGAPVDLWRAGGVFKGMCEGSGEREALRQALEGGPSGQGS